jgi:hypothetical protein
VILLVRDNSQARTGRVLLNQFVSVQPDYSVHRSEPAA